MDTEGRADKLVKKLEMEAEQFCEAHFGLPPTRAEILAVALRQAVYQIMELSNQ
jgi:hypothetical protein